jgi:hypothetical protein
VPATAWRYLVPYQPDFQRALDDLRAEAFRRGAFFQPWTDRGAPPFRPPTSIDDVLVLAGEKGTHSILDIHRFSLVAGPGLLSLVPDAVRLGLYGSLRPEREDVDHHKFALVHHMDEGEARLLVVWKGDAPDQLYLEGLTGG